MGGKIFRRWRILSTIFITVCLWCMFWTIKSEEDLVNNIFFIETSTSGSLNARQACSVESAARAHPNWRINVFFTSPIKSTFKRQFEKSFEGLQNIVLRYIDINEFVRDTPAWPLIQDGRLNKSKYRVSHASDVLRFTTLYRWSGIYLDLDIIIAKSLEIFSKNWAVRENKLIAAGAMAFSDDEIGRRFANISIRELEHTFSGKIWNNNGPGLITRVSKKICSTKDVTKMSPKTCSGFNVYGPENFYPIVWKKAKDYFKANKSIPESIAYHVWNKISHKYKIEKHSPYDRLAKKFCPNIYNSGTLS